MRRINHDVKAESVVAVPVNRIPNDGRKPVPPASLSPAPGKLDFIAYHRNVDDPEGRKVLALSDRKSVCGGIRRYAYTRCATMV